MFNVSISVLLYGCDVYNALALERKLENVKVGVHDMHNDRDVLSVDGKLMKKCNNMLLKQLGCVIFCFLKCFTFSLQTRYVITYKRNKEARSCNHCCSGKAVIITYCE
jgi:hypothetical protein